MPVWIPNTDIDISQNPLEDSIICRTLIVSKYLVYHPCNAYS